MPEIMALLLMEDAQYADLMHAFGSGATVQLHAAGRVAWTTVGGSSDTYFVRVKLTDLTVILTQLQWPVLHFELGGSRFTMTRPNGGTAPVVRIVDDADRALTLGE